MHTHAFTTIDSMARALEGRMTTSEELVRVHLERIDAVNPVLNAVVQRCDGRALAEARLLDAERKAGHLRGPLHGVPMTIKDSLDTAGVITTAGLRSRADHVPPADATVVRRLREAGAVLLGKTNTSALTLSFQTDNEVYGPTRNPHAADRSAGGSSGGAAAIVAAGGAPFDIGSDYGGSIRLPAHYCGVVGLKPTAGRVPRTGHAYPFGGILDSCQQIGPIARCVSDLELLLRVIAGPDGVDPGVAALPLPNRRDVNPASLRIAYHTDNGIARPSPETEKAVLEASGFLRETVESVVEARPRMLPETLELIGLYRWDGGAAVRRILGDTAGEISRPGRAASAEELDALIARWYRFRSGMLSFLEDFDAILCPVNEEPARIPGPEMYTDEAFTYTFSYNLTGWPAAVIRVGTSPDGLPIGAQIAAGPGREDVVLCLAELIERAAGPFAPPTIAPSTEQETVVP